MKFEIETDRSRKKKKEKYKQKIFMLIIGFIVLVFLILLITYLVLNSGNSKKRQMPVSSPTIIHKNDDQKEISIYNNESDDRPIAFIIDNDIADVKYAGLQSSYLNYEVPNEEGKTRIISIYKDKSVNLIGPIRNTESILLDYILESDAILVHYGSTTQTEKDLKELNINNIDGKVDKEPFRNDKQSISPHNVFTNIEYIKEYLNKTEYQNTSNNWKLLNISKEEIELNSGQSAKKITIPYTENEYRTYTYDDTNKYYLRSQNGSAHIDRQTTKQLHYKNIIIIKTKKSDENNQLLKTTGTGTGYYITNGSYNEITWTKETRNIKTVYKYTDGTELKLNDGNTFIQIVLEENNITIE